MVRTQHAMIVVPFDSADQLKRLGPWVIAKQRQNSTGSTGGIPGAESLYPSSEPSDLLTEAPGLGEVVSKYLKLQDAGWECRHSP